MKSVVVDKVASVAQHSDLGHELRLSPDIPCEEGVLVAVRVLNNKTRYNQLELTSGRMATVNQGDIVVGALGHRKALRGYSGHLPTSLKPGDTILGMSLDAGGHLTHGAKPNQSGKIYNAIQYGVRKQDNTLDYDQVQELANEHKPKLIIAGASAYPRIIDFPKIKEIADEVKEIKEKHGVVPGLVTILVGENPASISYVTLKIKTAHRVGFKEIQDSQPPDISEADLLALIDKYNKDDSINGILVQLPLPKHVNEKKVLNAIDPDKDVDGFHPVNVGRLMIGGST